MEEPAPTQLRARVEVEEIKKVSFEFDSNSTSAINLGMTQTSWSFNAVDHISFSKSLCLARQLVDYNTSQTSYIYIERERDRERERERKRNRSRYIHYIYIHVYYIFKSGVVAYTCNSTTFEVKFPSSVGSVPVWGNSPLIGGWILWRGT